MRMRTAVLLCLLIASLLVLASACSNELEINRSLNGDGDAPRVTLLSLSNNCEAGTNILIQGTVEDESGVQSLEAELTRLQDGVVSNYIVPLAGNDFMLTVPVACLGNYLLQLTAIDRVGNRGDTELIRIQVVHAPLLTIDNLPPTLLTNHSALSVQGTATILAGGKISAVCLVLNGGSTNTILNPVGLWSIPLNNLEEGTNTLQLFAVADSEKCSQTHTRTVIYDGTAPDAAFLLPASGQVCTSNQILVRASALDLLSGVQNVCLGVDVSDTNDVTQFTTLAPDLNETLVLEAGSHTLWLYAVDKAGNRSTLVSRPISVSLAAPTVNIVSPRHNSLTNCTSIMASGTAAAGAHSTLQQVFYRLDGNPFTAASGTTDWTVSLDSLSQGEHTLAVYATDQAGRCSPTNSVQFTVDSTRPVINTVTWPSADYTRVDDSEEQLFSGTCTASEQVWMEIRTNQGNVIWSGTVHSSPTAWSHTHTFSQTLSTSYTVRVYARDAAGNYSLTNTVHLHYLQGALCVSLSGSDSYKGTAQKPLKSLDTAAARAAATGIKTIRVKNDTFTPGNGLGTTSGVTVDTHGLSLIGGYDAAFTSRVSPTTLDGNNSVYHIIYANGYDNLTVDGFTIREGRADGSGDHIHGGGVFFRGNNLRITNCSILYNYALSYGGGIYVEGDTGSLATKCIHGTVAHNQGSFGGGIMLLSCTDFDIQCDVDDNQANSMGGGICIQSGGGHYLRYNSSMKIHNNRSDGTGGGVNIRNANTGTVAVFTEICNNTAIGYQVGGGMYVEDSTFTGSGNIHDNSPDNLIVN